jgi:hypothetical protein
MKNPSHQRLTVDVLATVCEHRPAKLCLKLQAKTSQTREASLEASFILGSCRLASGLAEIKGYLSLLPFDFQPRFKVSARLRQFKSTPTKSERIEHDSTNISLHGQKLTLLEAQLMEGVIHLMLIHKWVTRFPFGIC